MNNMRRYPLLWLLAACVTGPALANGAAVKVEYLNPDKFTDVRVRSNKTAPDTNQHLIQLKGWLESAAAKHLQNGQQLQIQISDIDLAGDYTPGSNAAASNIRTIKDLYPPYMKLSFTLKGADGAVVSSGERELRDNAFLMHSKSVSGSRELEYDKAMLERWLRKEFPTDM